MKFANVAVLFLSASLLACQSYRAESAADAPQAGTAPVPAQSAATVPAFVQAVCADCHAVAPPALSPNPKAPAFADIANREGLTAETLTQWLRDAHNYPEAMDFDLDPPQAGELAAYILTLGDPDYVPPTY